MLKKMSKVEVLEDGTTKNALICDKLKKLTLRNNSLTDSVTGLLQQLFPKYGKCSAATGNSFGHEYNRTQTQ